MYNFALVVVSLPKIRMTDYKYLKENKLFEAHMKFMKAIGESYGYSPIEEEDDDQNQQHDGHIQKGPRQGAEALVIDAADDEHGGNTHTGKGRIFRWNDDLWDVSGYKR